jgi:hypothetical protein
MMDDGTILAWNGVIFETVPQPIPTQARVSEQLRFRSFFAVPFLIIRLAGPSLPAHGWMPVSKGILGTLLAIPRSPALR